MSQSMKVKVEALKERVTKVPYPDDLVLSVYPDKEIITSNQQAVLDRYDHDLAALELCATDTLTINASSQFGRYV